MKPLSNDDFDVGFSGISVKKEKDTNPIIGV